MHLISPTRQLHLDFRNSYSNHGLTSDLVLRKHAGGGCGSAATVRNAKVPVGAVTLVKSNNSNRKDSTGATIASSSTTSNTITQHYYPEGGWVYMILITACVTHLLLCGLLFSSGILIVFVTELFTYENSTRRKVDYEDAVWFPVLSIGISLLFSPITTATCKRKSTRLVAVFGGLLISLGCLFTSFATQFHQILLSYGLFVGIGFGLIRDASSLMVGQYFKRKRELVEMILVSSTGLGIVVLSNIIHSAINSLGWRLGLQALTGFIFLTFFLGTCYRSASLYHPQRRAILHLKNQKRKVKEKEKREEQPPFLDFGCLRSKTLQILLESSAFISLGIYTPLFYLGSLYNEELQEQRQQQSKDVISEQTTITSSSSLYSDDNNYCIILYIIIGVLWILGCILFGFIVVQKSQECRVSRQYLCQMASTICAICIAVLPAVDGFNGLVIFACVYGFSLGAYNYILKIYTYERVRARHFPRAWSFIQAAQALPLIIGVPITGHINSVTGRNYGYCLSATAILFGSVFLFVTDFHKKNVVRRKILHSSMKTASETQESTLHSPSSRRLSFSFPFQDDPRSNSSQHSRRSQHSQSHHSQHSKQDEEKLQARDAGCGEEVDLDLERELTCISEEGIADMDFQDANYDDWHEYIVDCITSCNKVELEDCLISEFDPEHPMLQGKRLYGRKRSDTRRKLSHPTGAVSPASVVSSGIIGSAAVITIATGIAGLNLQPHVINDEQVISASTTENVKNVRSITTIEEVEDST